MLSKVDVEKEILTNFSLFLNSRTENIKQSVARLIIISFPTFHSKGEGDIVVVRIFDILILSHQASQSLLILQTGLSLHVNNWSLAALQALLASNCYSANTIQLWGGTQSPLQF